MKGRLAAIAHLAAPSLLSIALALLLCFVAAAIVVGSANVALDAYLAMLWGGLGDFPSYFDGAPFSVLARPWGESAVKGSLLALTGLSVAVGFRVGLFNIGGQGQMMCGALAAAVVGAHLSLPALLHVPLCLASAALAGGAWASIAAVLKLERGVHEVISTIMLNWIASSLIENWLLVGPLRATASGDHSLSGTDEIHPTAHLPRLFGDSSRMHVGLLLAIGASLLVALWLWRTRWGFETRAVGFSKEAAYASGIDVRWRIYQAFAIAGALAGMAGAVLVMGTEHKFPATLSAPYGFDGIAIALIGQNHPLGVLASAGLFGALRAGGTRMQLLGVHKSFPELIQGLALLFVAARFFWERLLERPTKRHGAKVT